MNEKTQTDNQLVVWLQMAEHFLDTETRQDLPLTALACVEAGLSPGEACRIWRYQVSPAVAFNLWDVAGEWAGWRPEWLEQTIKKRCAGGHYRPGVWGYLSYRLRVHSAHAYWRSIERFMQILSGYGTLDEQCRVAGDLRLLAQHYVDFGPFENEIVDDDRRQRMLALYPEPFVRSISPAVSAAGMKAGSLRIAVGLEPGKHKK